MALPGGRTDPSAHLYATIVEGVCSRLAGHLGAATELTSQLTRYSCVELRLAPTAHVVQVLAQRCSSTAQLRNLLLAVAHVSAEHQSQRLLARAVLAGCCCGGNRLGDLVTALLQLAAPPVAEPAAPQQQKQQPPASNPALLGGILGVRSRYLPRCPAAADGNNNSGGAEASGDADDSSSAVAAAADAAATATAQEAFAALTVDFIRLSADESDLPSDDFAVPQGPPVLASSAAPDLNPDYNGRGNAAVDRHSAGDYADQEKGAVGAGNADDTEEEGEDEDEEEEEEEEQLFSILRSRSDPKAAPKRKAEGAPPKPPTAFVTAADAAAKKKAKTATESATAAQGACGSGDDPEAGTGSCSDGQCGPCPTSLAAAAAVVVEAVQLAVLLQQGGQQGGQPKQQQQQRCGPEALGLLAAAVAERLFPLDPALASSWALRMVRQCFGSGGGSADGGCFAGAAGVSNIGTTAAAAAARCCAPHLVAVLGLPLLMHAAEEELLLMLRKGRPTTAETAAATAAAGEAAGAAGVITTTLRAVRQQQQQHGDSGGSGGGGVACRPVGVLLAAVAALDGEGEEAVWGLLSRGLRRALRLGGGGGGGGGALEGAAEAQGQRPRGGYGGGRGSDEGGEAAAGVADVRLAVEVLAAVEVVVTEMELYGGSGGGGGTGATDPAAAAGAAPDSTIDSRLDALFLKPSLLLLPPPPPSASIPAYDTSSHAGRRSSSVTAAAATAAALRAVQLHVPYCCSIPLLSAYERLVNAALAALLHTGPAGAGPVAAAGLNPPGPNARLASGGNTAAVTQHHHHQQQQQHQQRLEAERWRLKELLASIQSRKEHLGAGGGGGGRGGRPMGHPTAAAAAAAMGPQAAVVVGDRGFACRCLEEFGRLGKEHLKKYTGVQRGRWQRDAKPVLLQPTLNAATAAQRYKYLQAASELRLVTLYEVDCWEALHTALGLQLMRGSTGPQPPSEPPTATGSPAEDLLSRLALAGPSLADPRTLVALMRALDAALREELMAGVVGVGEGGCGGVMSGSGALQPAGFMKQQQPQPEGGAGGLTEGGQVKLQKEEEEEVERRRAAAAERIAELVLQAFVAAEELVMEAEAAEEAEAAAAATHPPPAGVAGLSCRRRRLQSHQGWQLALLDVVSRWPPLHAPLVERLSRLASDSALTATLDEPQVMGLAAALACMSSVRRLSSSSGGGVGGGGGGGAAEARYVWWLPPRQQRQQPAAAAATEVVAVPGPALAEAVLAALPLGPSAPQLRFSATFLVAYLRRCGVMDTWVVYDSPSLYGDEACRGASAAVSRNTCRTAGHTGSSDGWADPKPLKVLDAVADAEGMVRLDPHAPTIQQPQQPMQQQQ
ncbi:hypothetical protein Agub_g6013, partial [Astrephomene gubernaculifera]